jgi:uncharacterized Zn-finger protein
MSSLPFFHQRILKLKKPTQEIFCPLCRTLRHIRFSPRMKKHHFIQMTVLTFLFVFFFWNIFKERGLFIFFLIWSLWEGFVRWSYKKEVPCPHCGFDATLYKRDVRQARQKVKEFWNQKDVEYSRSIVNDR